MCVCGQTLSRTEISLGDGETDLHLSMTMKMKLTRHQRAHIMHSHMYACSLVNEYFALHYKAVATYIGCQ